MITLIHPRNISQFKKWARENQGIRLFLHYDQRKAVRNQVTLVLANQSSVLFIDEAGQTFKIVYPKKGHYRFMNDSFSFKTMVFKYHLPEEKKPTIDAQLATTVQKLISEGSELEGASAKIGVSNTKLELDHNIPHSEWKSEVLNEVMLLIDKMWELAVKYGYDKKGPVLVLPDYATDFIKSACCPTEQIFVFASRLADRLSLEREFYLKVFHGPEGFRGLFLTCDPNLNAGILNTNEGKFDLVIGMPYAESLHSSVELASDLARTQATTQIEYYLTRGLDLLRSGGLFVSLERADIMNGELLFLQSGITAVKKAIAAQATIVDSYRLPTFVWNGQEMNSEIMVIQKN